MFIRHYVRSSDCYHCDGTRLCSESSRSVNNQDSFLSEIGLLSNAENPLLVPHPRLHLIQTSLHGPQVLLPTPSAALPTHGPRRPNSLPTVLRLPSKEICNGGNRLTQDRKTQPKDQIPDQLDILTLRLQERIRQENQRQLPHHPEERKAENIVRRHTDKEFVQDAGEEESDDLSDSGGNTTGDHGGVDVAFHEVSDRFVPGGPVGADGVGVPPVGVEFAVGEVGYLSEAVEEGLEEGEESGEPDYQADCAELEDAFEDGGEVECGYGGEAVVEQGDGVLR